jgi:hypothetical protein
MIRKSLMFTSGIAALALAAANEGGGAPAAPAEKTPEQVAAEKAAAAQAKADAKAIKDKAAADKKEAAAKAKADKLAAKEAEKAAKAQAAKDAKAKKVADAAAAREAARMPEQNGIRRPKPDTLCGQAWGIFDAVSAKNGAPASITESMTDAKAKGLNEANVRAEYARWRKFHGITGRIEAPAAAVPPAPPAAA